MAKKKSIGRFEIGTKVQVKPGVTSPEFSDFALSGWTGIVSEVAGKKTPVTYVLEWDESTLTAMPPEYVERCEREGLYFRMVCLTEDDLQPAT
jgi:hypothetical protein